MSLLERKYLKLPTKEVVPPDISALDAYTHESEQELLLKVVWTYNGFNTFTAELTNGGKLEQFAMSPRSWHSITSELTADNFESLQQIIQLLEVEAIPTTPFIGDTIIAITLPSGKIIHCANRSCPVTLRQLLSYVFSTNRNVVMPFTDENFFDPDMLAWFVWYVDSSKPPQRLGIRKDLLTTTYYDGGNIGMEVWYINEKEYAQIKGCLDTLKSNSDSGLDADVIKISYPPDGATPLIRIDKSKPTDCLISITTLLQESLQDAEPDARITINPFEANASE